MKKLHVAVIAIAACALAFGLAACDKAGTEDPEPEAQTTQTADDGAKVDDADKGKKDEGSEKGTTSESAANNTGSTGSNGSTAGNTKPNHTHKWATRYVVDKAAWTEVIHHDAVYEFPPSYQVYLCQCGFETTSGAEIMAHQDATSHSYGTATRGGGSVLVRDAWDETINHPEKGHNETYCTKCGAIQ